MVNSQGVIITGASGTLGRAMAQAFGRHQWNVGVHYNQSDSAAQETAKIVEEQGGSALLLKADLRNSQEVDQMVSRALQKWGKIDVLVNNAGISQDRLIDKMNDKEWKNTLDVNLNGPFYCSRAVWPAMQKQKKGAIIHIISLLTHKPARGAINYSVSKAGLLALSKSLALEGGRYNIRSNAIMPGFHVTGMNRHIWEKYEKNIRAEHLLARLPEKNELGEFVFSISQLETVTGQEFAFESRLF